MKNKWFYFLFLILTIIILLALTKKDTISEDQKDSQSIDLQVPGTNTSNPEQPIYSDFNTFISKQACESRLNEWREINFVDTVMIKAPSYITVDPQGMGGLGWTIRHPKLGEFGISTGVIGDFEPPGTPDFESSLRQLMNIGSHRFNDASYYKDERGYTYVIGKGRVIVAKDELKARWWELSIVYQGEDAVFPEREEALVSDVDFTCLLRSTSFIN